MEGHSSLLKRGKLFLPRYLTGKVFSNNFARVVSKLSNSLGLGMKQPYHNDFVEVCEIEGTQEVDFALMTSHGRPLIFLELESLSRSQFYIFTDGQVVSGPVFDCLRYVPEDSLIAELFVNLLARAIDKERVHEAHPAFTHTIAQLSPDEAVILFHLKKRTFVYRQQARYDRESNTFSPRTLLDNEFPTEQLAFSQNFPMYMDHLHSLDLAGIWQQGNQESTWEGDPKVQTGVKIKSIIALTTFGGLFCKACVPDEMPKEDPAFQREKHST